MSAWTHDELERIGSADALEIAPAGRTALPIWVVRVGDELYVRSWRGRGGAWFRAAMQTRHGHIAAGGVEKDVTFEDAPADVQGDVDAAYRSKYGRYPGYVEPMVSDQARATTLALVPAGEEAPQ